MLPVDGHESACLNNRKLPGRRRCCPWRAGRLAKAIHALQAREMRR